MTKKQTIQFGVAATAVIVVLAVIIFRNSPRFTEAVPQVSVPGKPPVLELPSKSNVTSSFTERVVQLRKSSESNPKNAAHLISLAQLLMDGHQNKEAIVYFKKAVLLQPKNDSLLLDLSVCYFNDKDYGNALRTTEKILSLNRYHTRALYNKGAILATQERKVEAIAVWKMLIQHDPLSEEAKTVRGNISRLEMK
ncbi:MAG: tetratricopeptide repeat protein [Bacteroidetes bacterium]|nr:tetratricopeptide repeat protein [Bacteroidota bacterium]